VCVCVFCAETFPKFGYVAYAWPVRLYARNRTPNNPLSVLSDL